MNNLEQLIVGDTYLNEGRYDDALACYGRVLRTDPANPEAWFAHGVVLGILDRHAEALASYDSALETDPGHADAWFARGYELGNLGRYEDAVVSFDRAVEIDSTNAEAWQLRGVALDVRLGMPAEAVQSYERALEIDPANGEAWFGHGSALGNLGRYEDAVVSFDRAIKIDPTNINAWFFRGAALGNLGRYDDASASFEQVLDIDPEHAGACLLLTFAECCNMTPLIPDDESRLAWLDGDRVIVGRCRLDLYDGGVLVVIDAPNRVLPITEPLAALMEIHLAPVADGLFSAGGWQGAADEVFPISILSIPVISWLSEEGYVMYGLGKVELHPEAGEVFDEGLSAVYREMEPYGVGRRNPHGASSFLSPPYR